jgi:hypothetical protein
LFDSFLVQNGLKNDSDISQMFFNFALDYAINKVQENQLGLKLGCSDEVI